MRRTHVEALAQVLGEDATLRQALTLLVVAVHPDGVTPATVERETSSSQSAVCRNLRLLRMLGLVGFQLDQADGRTRRAVLTPLGRELFAGIGGAA